MPPLGCRRKSHHLDFFLVNPAAIFPWVCVRRLFNDILFEPHQDQRAGHILRYNYTMESILEKLSIKEWLEPLIFFYKSSGMYCRVSTIITRGIV